MTQPNPKRPRHVQVQSVHDLSPHLRRIVFHSPELADYPHTCAAAHLKVLLPKAPGEIPVLPEITPRGPRWADPAQKPVTRTYTLRHLDNAACTLAIDFVRHGDNGPASAFAEHAQVGQVVGLSAPVGPNPLLKPARRYLMAADLSALPALCALADTLPPDCNGDIFLLLPEPADLPAFRLPEKLRLHVAYGAAEHYPALAEGLPRCPNPMPKAICGWPAKPPWLPPCATTPAAAGKFLPPTATPFPTGIAAKPKRAITKNATPSWTKRNNPSSRQPAFRLSVPADAKENIAQIKIAAAYSTPALVCRLTIPQDKGL